MADERVIQLLEEIRDLQKQHMENHKNAIQNQEQTIAIARQAAQRQKLALIVIGVLLLALLGLPTLLWGMSWLLRR